MTELTTMSPREVRDRARFIRSVTHDLRAPLRAVIQFANAASSRLPEVDESVRSLLRRVVDAAMQLDTRMSALRRFHESIGVPGTETPLRIVIADAVTAYSASGVDISVNDGHETLVPSAIGVVLGNLLDNAIKYGARHVALTSRVSADVAYLEIRDDGIGFPLDQAERIFDPFTRTLQATRRAEGSGMGLTLCRELIERMGGRIWTESEGEGRGSTFSIAVPLFGELVTESDGRAILVVEDDDRLRSIAARTLRTLGRVGEANSVRSALLAAGREHFDLLFVDMRLGERDDDGARLVKMIRRRSQNPLVPVIITSGFITNDAEGASTARACTANAWLGKPWSPKALEAIAKHYLER